MSVPSIQPVETVLNVIIISTMAIGVTLFALGLFLRNPAYHDKAPEFMINMQVIIFLIMIPFFFGLIFLDIFLYDMFGIVDSFYYIVTLVAVVNLVVGLIMLYIGGRHLAQME
jgi:hypothetical protein